MPVTLAVYETIVAIYGPSFAKMFYRPVSVIR
ncbi:hypothetical protein OCH239_01705 [Roseivivax halodurans JCM 10272]|uniref:Uncharacterized protein n=1 Tax=Roseivivax halodurans JCM 10272 TaxID=1449350 RepID=X7ENI7_9RHOB|nr:hypothetical protein OCH239_01705 [Roseivivax halodurans JCM 10272]